MSYLVVFEANQSTGLSYGIRTIVDYADQEEFERLGTGNKFLDAIAKDVSEDEARELACQTPEIVRFAHALDEALQSAEDGKPSPAILDYQFEMAIYGIELDRQQRFFLGVHRLSDASKYIEHLRELAKEDGLKGKILDLLLSHCTSQDGFMYYEMYPTMAMRAIDIVNQA